jgi:nucleoside-diphosphate-sugar epimerase
MSGYVREDASYVAGCPFMPWDDLAGRTVVITGATGLIGHLLACSILERNRLAAGSATEVVALVRDVAKAEGMFPSDSVRIVRWDAMGGEVPELEAADFIVHCASPTSSSAFLDSPVETIRTNVRGTEAMLELARAHGASLCMTSSMEVYGAGSDEPLSEERGGELDSMNPRSSYPEAKQLSEALCAGYAHEFGTHACVARLSQTFGAGVPKGDTRVFAEFARDCIEGRDIRLLTDGSKRNMYLYTADAVTALLLLVAKGEPGKAYNVANEETLTSIREMASMVADRFGHGHTKVVVDIDEEAAKRYRPGNVVMLDTARLRALGWSPRFGLMEMYERLIGDWRDRER